MKKDNDGYKKLLIDIVGKNKIEKELLAKTKIDEIYAEVPLPIKLNRIMEHYLTPRRKHIVECRYGIAEYSSSNTLEYIGKSLNLTRERVRQLQNEAIHELKKYKSQLVGYISNTLEVPPTDERVATWIYGNQDAKTFGINPWLINLNNVFGIRHIGDNLIVATMPCGFEVTLDVRTIMPVLTMSQLRSFMGTAVNKPEPEPEEVIEPKTEEDDLYEDMAT